VWTKPLRFKSKWQLKKGRIEWAFICTTLMWNDQKTKFGSRKFQEFLINGTIKDNWTRKKNKLEYWHFQIKDNQTKKKLETL
jgi:hypothetical protein